MSSLQVKSFEQRTSKPVGFYRGQMCLYRMHLAISQLTGHIRLCIMPYCIMGIWLYCEALIENIWLYYGYLAILFCLASDCIVTGQIVWVSGWISGYIVDIWLYCGYLVTSWISGLVDIVAGGLPGYHNVKSQFIQSFFI